MWTNLKKGIDNFIAEEQARQRSAQQTPPRSTASASRVARQAASGARGSHGGSPRPVTPRRNSGEPPTRSPAPTSDPASKGPDPADFETPEFVIDDEDGPSRSSTPANPSSRSGTPNPTQARGKPAEEGAEGAENKKDGTTQLSPEDAKDSKGSPDLPADVKAKLRKLDRLESRYQELLKSYRVAHSRVSAIEIFEAALREYTPLTSINDPTAFTEYINQTNVKNDMVLDELKKVSNEKNKLQTRVDAAEKEAKEAKDELATLKKRDSIATETTESTAVEQPTMEDTSKVKTPDQRRSVESRRDSAPEATKSPPLAGMFKTAGISLFSPKAKQQEFSQSTDEAEELFSYDNEFPRLENELEASQKQVTGLQKEVKDLRNDLTVARESTQSMVQTLEDATREANQLREQNEELRSSTDAEISNLRTELEEADGKMRRMQIELEQKPAGAEISEQQKEELSQAASSLAKLKDAEKKLETAELEKAELVEKLQHQEKEAAAATELSTKRSQTIEKLVEELKSQLKSRDEEISKLRNELSGSADTAKSLQSQLDDLQAKQKTAETTSETKSAAVPAESKSQSEGAKKKNNKKKKGKGSTVGQTKSETAEQAETTPSKDHGEDAEALRKEVSSLQEQVKEKDAAIERLHAKLKDQDGLKEEIETLRDDLVNVGQEHVDAKENIKTLETEKAALKEQIESLEKEMVDLRASASSDDANDKESHNDLVTQFEELKLKSGNLQTDLAVANKLASSRFKDLQDLRSALQKAQPELTTLRKDNAELKTAKTDLQARVSELERIETRHNTVRSELTNARKLVGEKDSEISALNKKLLSEISAKEREDENRKKAVRAQETAETDRRQASQSLERAQKDLTKAREELNTSRTRISELESSLSKVQREVDSFKEEIELKTAQHASAESLMTSMRDQTSEMATQSKETRARCESLEEELSEAHRLLGERSREAETMRRLLNEIEGRTEGRLREMKDRLDSAIEERDRIEDEASTSGRRRARELDEVRSKLRDAERDLKRAEADKEELESASRDWRRRRDELEQRAEATGKESDEVRKAMAALRDALDESERQARELEKQKSDLQRAVDDAQQRLDRATKSNKIMAEEMRNLQNKARASPATQSPRVSMDAARAKAGTPSSGTVNGQGGASSEAYLKNILLQFMETREHKHRVQLIPVLGMLLHFDKQDEQKWMSAISAK